MASLVYLKQLRVPVSRFLRPAVATDIFNRISLTARRTYHESFSLTPTKTVPHSFMREDVDGVYAFLDLPGIPKGNVKVTVDCNRQLWIKGDLDAAYICECRNYAHKIDLPEKINTTGIKADLNDDVLKLTLPVKMKENKEEKLTHEAIIPVN